MISSMTAFASSNLAGDWGQLVWEVRSINHRYLEQHFRLPEQFYVSEIAYRNIIKEYLKRGKLDCTLRYFPGDSIENTVNINHNLIHSLQQAGTQIALLCNKGNTSTVQEINASLSVSELLHWPGSIEIKQTVNDELLQVSIKALEKTLQQLISGRRSEGEKLQYFLLTRNSELTRLLKRAKQLTSDTLEVTRAKLQQKIAQYDITVEAARLEQEIVLAVQRFDVTEELDRLQTHISEFERLVSTQAVVGRQLDFLMQEFNREANTLASKSNQTELTQIAVQMKVTIEQMREQIQNIE